MNGDRREKNIRPHITAFYMETLFLAVIFVLLIMILVRIFALSVHMSDSAGQLTGAVQLAENAAEAVAASDSPEELLALLDEGGNAKISQDGVICEYSRDMQPYPGGDIQVRITWEPKEDGCVDSRITVFSVSQQEPVYTISTAVFIKGAVS